MKNPKVFEVTAIEYFKAEGDADPKKPIIHHYKVPLVGENATGLEFQVKMDLAKGFEGDAIAAFHGRLKVEVADCPFPGN